MRDKYRAAFLSAGACWLFCALVLMGIGKGPKVHPGWPILFGPIIVMILLAVVSLFLDD